jgi:hypothetical protein
MTTAATTRMLEAYAAAHKPMFEHERISRKDVQLVVSAVPETERADYCRELRVEAETFLISVDKLTDDDVYADWMENGHDGVLSIGVPGRDQGRAAGHHR